MSYSFTVKGATKNAVKALVILELDKVVVAQPVHAHDAQHAQVAAHTFIDLLADDATKDIVVSVNGSLGWQGLEMNIFTSANVSVSAYYVMRAPD